MMAVRLNSRRLASLEKVGSATLISLALCFSVGLVLADSDDESRNLLFKEPIPNQALQGHVIKTEQVLNEGSCRVQCYLEPNCVSINVGPLKDGAHQCELNNATDENQFAAALKKKTAHTYLAIENPCSSSPCNSSGTCQAGFTSEGFRCICPAGIIGKTCDIVKVACFIYADQLTELRDFTGEVNRDVNTNKVVKACAALAKAKDYKRFALGKSGVCLSGPDMKKKYHVEGSLSAECNHGIGIGNNNMFVYSLAPRPSLQTIGCYHDESNDRALPEEYANFRGSGKEKPGQIDWYRMELTVYNCAQVAYDKGYEYFAVQFHGVCYGGKDAGETYAKHGKSEDCWEFDKQNGFGVGMKMTNFVYRIKQVG